MLESFRRSLSLDRAPWYKTREVGRASPSWWRISIRYGQTYLPWSIWACTLISSTYHATSLRKQFVPRRASRQVWSNLIAYDKSSATWYTDAPFNFYQSLNRLGPCTTWYVKIQSGLVFPSPLINSWILTNFTEIFPTWKVAALWVQGVGSGARSWLTNLDFPWKKEISLPKSYMMGWKLV